MITKLIYRCPVCGKFDWLKDNNCIFCNASVKLISRTKIDINDNIKHISFWYQKILSFDLPINTDNSILKSNKVVLSKEIPAGKYIGFDGLWATQYMDKKISEGLVTLFTDSITFESNKEKKKISFNDIKSVTIESNTLIISTKTFGPLFFKFYEESGKMWEDCIKKTLINYYLPKNIIEFYPKIIFSQLTKSKTPKKNKKYLPLKVPTNIAHTKRLNLLYLLIKLLAKLVFKIFFKVKIKGAYNIPKDKSCIILSNHASFLDSLLLTAFTKRRIWFMTKNSQYKGKFICFILKYSGAFPVRRYTTDVQAVRNAIRVIQNHHALGIFPEGERNWDENFLPFKRGTIRLILALGKPVIPIGISGAYGVMPRWTKKIKCMPIKIKIGKPLYFKNIPISEQCCENIDETSSKIQDSILNLLTKKN